MYATYTDGATENAIKNELKHQIFHRDSVFQRNIKSCFFAVACSADQYVEKAVSCFYAAILFHAFQLMAVNLNAEMLKLVQY